MSVELLQLLRFSILEPRLTGVGIATTKCSS